MNKPAASERSVSVRRQHARIEARCTLLAQLARHVLIHGVDAWACRTAGSLVAFFDTAYQPLRDPSSVEHYREIETLWASLREKLAGMEDGRSTWLRRTETRRFRELYIELIRYRQASFAEPSHTT